MRASADYSHQPRCNTSAPHSITSPRAGDKLPVGITPPQQRGRKTRPSTSRPRSPGLTKPAVSPPKPSRGLRARFANRSRQRGLRQPLPPAVFASCDPPKAAERGLPPSAPPCGAFKVPFVTWKLNIGGADPDDEMLLPPGGSASDGRAFLSRPIRMDSRTKSRPFPADARVQDRDQSNICDIQSEREPPPLSRSPRRGWFASR